MCVAVCYAVSPLNCWMLRNVVKSLVLQLWEVSGWKVGRRHPIICKMQMEFSMDLERISLRFSGWRERGRNLVMVLIDAYWPPRHIYPAKWVCLYRALCPKVIQNLYSKLEHGHHFLEFGVLQPIFRPKPSTIGPLKDEFVSSTNHPPASQYEKMKRDHKGKNIPPTPFPHPHYIHKFQPNVHRALGYGHVITRFKTISISSISIWFIQNICFFHDRRVQVLDAAGDLPGNDGCNVHRMGLRVKATYYLYHQWNSGRVMLSLILWIDVENSRRKQKSSVAYAKCLTRLTIYVQLSCLSICYILVRRALCGFRCFGEAMTADGLVEVVNARGRSELWTSWTNPSIYRMIHWLCAPAEHFMYLLSSHRCLVGICFITG